jgi:hypothetical protein
VLLRELVGRMARILETPATLFRRVSEEGIGVYGVSTIAIGDNSFSSALNGTKCTSVLLSCTISLL